MSLKGFEYDVAIIMNGDQEWHDCNGEVQHLVRGDMVLVHAGHDYIVPVDVAHIVAGEVGLTELLV